MANSHCYTLKRTPDLCAQAIIGDIASLIAASDVSIVNDAGEPGTLPLIADDMVLFNGEEPDSCEPFQYPPDTEWNRRYGLPVGFGRVKTSFYPYDEVVKASLMVIKHHLGEDVEVSSADDVLGTPEAVSLFERTFPDRDAASLCDG